MTAAQNLVMTVSAAILLIIFARRVYAADLPDISNDLLRVKRQSSYASANSGAIQDGNNFIDSIFQIPISTLNAVGSLIKNTRPIVMRARERIQQQYDQYQQQQSSSQSSQTPNSRPSRGSGVYSIYNNYVQRPQRGNKRRRVDRVEGRDYPSF